ncbi:uncharacterized protein CTRU02_201616 [Colletotrichum truncatum]|uniref:Uncharacterized protein n=1 Tax=Colletotrichum truncatum TaxID=5467 RepID=A0ACC3ZHY4_COLTU|nr:uncharacterized protein CTRU02_10846 [Colletotrichum truncatum]KAF6786722.1 hypothetical protein CTRU02_10846 [Colletotrichum truncatum]
MKLTLLTLTAIVGWVTAMPQEQPQVPQIPAVSTSLLTITVTGQQPAPTVPIPNIPVPIPEPVPVPVPTSPVNPPGPPTPGVPDPAQPAPAGAHCVCGATYCGKVLVGFQGYTSEQLGQGYCSTPGTNCGAAAPAPESLEDTLFVCICPPGQKEGSTIELICPCQGRCKNDEPDFIGRCEKPCNLGCGPATSGATGSPAPAPAPVPVPIPAIPVEPLPAPAPPKRGKRS